MKQHARCKYVPPSDQEILDAVQPLPDNHERNCGSQCPVFDPRSTLFRPIPKPRSGDWLYSYYERPQPLRSFMRRSFKGSPHGCFRTIYIQKVTSKKDRQPESKDIVEYLEAFFPGMNVKFLPKVHIDNTTIHTDFDEETGIQRCYTEEVFEWFRSHMKQEKLRAACRTMLFGVVLLDVDLVPSSENLLEIRGWLRGLAVPMDGIAQVSTLRHDPAAISNNWDVPLKGDDIPLYLKRCLITLAHEICHLLGLMHCVYQKCLMNGVSEDQERYDHPLFLCPVCLRKISEALYIDHSDRYSKLLAFCESRGLFDDADWLQRRLLDIELCRCSGISDDSIPITTKITTRRNDDRKRGDKSKRPKQSTR